MGEKIADIITVIGLLFVCGVFIWMFYYLIDYANFGAKQGIVIDKQYTSEHTYTEYSISHIGNETIKIPYQKYVAEKYQIKLQKTVDGKQKSIWIDITPEEYNSLKIGDNYNNYLEE